VLRNPASQLQESASVGAAILSAKGIKPYTTAVDIWAVGVLAYELVCGKPPFKVEDEAQTASLIMYSNSFRLPSAHSSLWADFVKQALIKDPEQRPDASALLTHPW
jgi:serine/threonine protein kinase